MKQPYNECLNRVEAPSEADRLRAEIAKLKEMADHHSKLMWQQVAKCDKLRAEVARLQEWVAREKSIDEEMEKLCVECMTVQPLYGFVDGLCVRCQEMTKLRAENETLRAVVDVARRVVREDSRDNEYDWNVFANEMADLKKKLNALDKLPIEKKTE